MNHEHLHGERLRPVRTEIATPKQENPSGAAMDDYDRELQGRSDDPQTGQETSDDRGSMSHTISADHEQTMWRDSLWASFVNLAFGAWLVTSPFTFGYRSVAMTWSDVLGGTMVIIFSLLSMYRGFTGNLARWANCFVGIWLLFAPLVFWTPDAVAYANDTLVGSLVIAFAVLVPMMPGMDMSVMEGAEVPPGWSYNPSSWLQRAPIILLALVGFLASRYMAAYQLGHIKSIWDPFFGDGTRRVLESKVSKMFPISDAGLGAVSYVLEMLMGFMGDKARWRTMPWMVTFFGILVVPLGTVSVVLIILQPLAVGTWCTLCLVAGAAMLAMVPAALDEVVAMIQFLVRSQRQGRPFWHTFWLGGSISGGVEESRLTPFDWSRPFSMFLTWVTSNWSLLLVTTLGVWTMFAPTVLGNTGAVADGDHLVGALVVTFAVIAMGEVGRVLRFINIPLGLWLAGASWLLGGANAAARWNSVVTGLAILLLSLPRGQVRGRYGSWDRYIR